MNNSPAKLADLTAFIENPFPIQLILDGGIPIVTPVTAELWFDDIKQEDQVIDVDVTGNQIDLELSVAQLRAMPPRTSLFIKFADEYVFQAAVKTTLNGSIPNTRSIQITFPSIGTVRVSTYSDKALAAGVAAVDGKVALASAYATEAKTAAALAGSTFEDKGAWVPATNMPMLNATPVMGAKPMQYTIRESGEMPFSIPGYASGAVVPTGYLRQNPSGGWYYYQGDAASLRKYDLQFTEGAVLVGEVDLSSYTSNNTTLSETRVFGTTSQGILETINLKASRAGFLQFKIVRKIGSTFDVIYKFNVTLVSGNNTFVKGTHFKALELLPNDYIAWYYTPTTGYIHYKTQTDTNYQIAGNATGSGLTATTTTTVKWAINFTVSEAITAQKITTVDTEVVSSKDLALTNEALLKARFGTNPDQTVGQTASLSTFTTTSGADDSTRIIDAPLQAGYLKEIELWCRNAGNLKCFIIAKNLGNTYTILETFNVTIALGLNVLDSGDFGNIYIREGSYFGWYTAPTTGRIGYKTMTGNGLVYAGGEASGEEITFIPTSGFDFGVNVTVSNGAIGNEINDISARVTAVESQVGVKRTGTPAGLIKKYPLLTTSIPSDWVTAGGWTATTSGLESPVSGGWGVYAYWDKTFSFDEDEYSARVTVSTTTTIFALVRKSLLTVGTSIFEVDFSGSLLKIYPEVTGLGVTPGSAVATQAIPFAAVVGREYIAKLRKDREIYYGTLIDTVTQQTVTVTFNSVGASPSCGVCVDAPGVIFRSGGIKISEILYTTPMPKNPRIFIQGNSITNGDTIRLLAGGGYTKRWAGLLSEHVYDNIFITARGGDTTALAAGKRADALASIDKIGIAIYGIGINDTSFATWQAGWLAFKSAVEAKGAEAIPCTLFPRTGREAFCTQVTDYVLASGSRYIDFAKALTIDGLRVTRDASLFTGDNLHPNVAGHLKMYNQVIQDLGL